MGCLPALFPLDVILNVVEMEVEGEIVCELSPKKYVGSVGIIPGKSQSCDVLNLNNKPDSCKLINHDCEIIWLVYLFVCLFVCSDLFT